MRKTYAYNSIIFGFLFGILVYVSTESIVLTILTVLGVSVVGFILIRLLENALSRGVDKAVDKVSDAYRERKARKAAENGSYAPSNTTQMPNRTTTQFPQRGGQDSQRASSFCTACGAKISAASQFCPGCGRKLK